MDIKRVFGLVLAFGCAEDMTPQQEPEDPAAERARHDGGTAEGGDLGGSGDTGASPEGQGSCRPRWPEAAEVLEDTARHEMDRRYRWPLDPGQRLFAGRLYVFFDFPDQPFEGLIPADRAVLLPGPPVVLALRGRNNHTMGIRWDADGTAMSFAQPCDPPRDFPVQCLDCPPPPRPGEDVAGFESRAVFESHEGTATLFGFMSPMEVTYFAQLYELSMACPPVTEPELRDGQWSWDLDLAVDVSVPAPADCPAVVGGRCRRSIAGRVDTRIGDLPPFPVSAQVIEIIEDQVTCRFVGAAQDVCFDPRTGGDCR